MTVLPHALPVTRLLGEGDRLPCAIIDPGLPPVLVYPARRGPEWWHGPACGDASRALSNLLGPTRAACLRGIEDGCTTGELARRIGGTSPTASQHATTLREAGLITSTRQGNTVIHTVTPLGAALLEATPGDALLGRRFRASG